MHIPIRKNRADKTSLHASLTLKLNSCWQAMGYMSVRDTFNRMFTTGHNALNGLDIIITPEGGISRESRSYTGPEWVKLPVRECDPWIGLSHHRRIRVPLATIIPHHNTVPKIRLQFNKKGLYTRDRGICSYCLRLLTYDEATNDHIQPVSKGGETNWDNCTLACTPCNSFKGDRTVEEAGMVLRRKPKQPSLMPVLPELRADAPMEHIVLLYPKHEVHDGVLVAC